MTPFEAAFGIDLDRLGRGEPALARARRWARGRYPVDAFGAEPLWQDLADPVLESLFSFEVEGGEEHLPEIGAATLVTTRRPGFGDSMVVRAVVRDVRRRRARIAGYPDLPVAGGGYRRLGYIRSKGEDVAACLRAGHVVVVPLAPTARLTRAGAAPVKVLWGAIGHPVIPVVVRGGMTGPLGLAVGHHRVSIGPPLDVDVVPRDPLSAAELATAAREAIQTLLDLPRV